MLGWRWGDWALLAANPATSPQSTASATPPTATPAVQPLLQPPAALSTVDTPCRRSAGRHLPHRDSNGKLWNIHSIFSALPLILTLPPVEMIWRIIFQNLIV